MLWPTATLRAMAMHRPTDLARPTAGSARTQRRGGLRGTSIPVTPVAWKRHGVVRYSRPKVVLSGWEVTLDRPGRLRLKNAVLYRKGDLCHAIERELMTVTGIEKYKT